MGLHALGRLLAGVDRGGLEPTAYGDLDGGPEPGRVTEAPWDADLATALRAHGRALPEEHVADALLSDLAHHCRPA